jgi:acylphosphatase
MAAQRDRGSGTSAVHLRVSGRVQGVGFRYFIVSRAQALGAVGFAKNLPDGDVEIWAEGTETALTAVIAAARTGPARASVADVEIREVEATGSYPDFEVRY